MGELLTREMLPYFFFGEGFIYSIQSNRGFTKSLLIKRFFFMFVEFKRLQLEYRPFYTFVSTGINEVCLHNYLFPEVLV